MIGRKSADALRREFGDLYIDDMKVCRVSVNYNDAAKLPASAGLKLTNLMYVH